MWEWLSDSDHQRTLGFLGGGLAAVAAAAWAVFRYLRQPAEKGKPPSVAVTADRGGRAAGRDYNEVSREPPPRATSPKPKR